MKKKLGLLSGVSTGIGMIIATSCFISLADGAGKVGTSFIIAIILVCLLNMMAAASIAELNALMPNLTGGLAQYTLVGLGPFISIVTMVGGYLISNIFAAPAEGAMFSNVMYSFLGDSIPEEFYSVGLTILLIVINLLGVNMSAKLQTIIASFMIASLLIMGVIGAFGMGLNKTIQQPVNLSLELSQILPLTAVAFWLFIGSEFIIPIGKDMKNAARNVPLSMFLSLIIMCIIQVLMVLGFQHYTPWDELAAANSPHILYSVNMLGQIGRYWIIIVAIFAAVSTQNSIIGCVSEICCGMANIHLLPAIFQRKNKRNAPYVVILFLGILTILIEASGISTGSQVSFLILTSSLFWMLSYIVSHINVLVLRKKMRRVPRTFKVPFCPLFQIIGIIGTAYMMFHISTDPVEQMNIFKLSGMLFLGLAVYAYFWIKYHMHLPLFQQMEISQVMAMEDPMYHQVRHNRPSSKSFLETNESL